MKYVIDFPFHENVIRDVVLNEPKLSVSGKVGYICFFACDEVINAGYGVTFSKKPVAKMGAKKTSPPSDDRDHAAELLMILESIIRSILINQTP